MGSHLNIDIWVFISVASPGRSPQQDLTPSDRAAHSVSSPPDHMSTIDSGEKQVVFQQGYWGIGGWRRAFVLSTPRADPVSQPNPPIQNRNRKTPGAP